MADAEVIERVMKGRSTLAIMPTGAGKSLCYQLPALMRDGVTVVISPLIALMHDQIRSATAAGIRAASMTSADSDNAATAEAFRNGELDLLYVAPERASTTGFQSLLERAPVSLFAIDEAHCVSEWGHDFRPDYRMLRPVLDRLWRDRPFDVIDASFFFPDGPAAVALGRHYGVPVSIKARGADIHHWGRVPATAAQVLAAGRTADGLLAVSEAMADDMAALGMPRPFVHHTGVDLDRFAPAADRAAAKAALGVAGPLVLSVGALIPRKGHDIVIDAVARLDGVTLAIAGQGPEQASLAAQAARLGITDRVRLLGGVPHADLPRWVGAADAMALASSSEGLANAWVEALACGTPIVIPDAGGAREVVTGAAAGRIVARDPSAVADALAGLLANPPAASATRAFAERFTWDRNTATLYTHLKALMTDRVS